MQLLTVALRLEGRTVSVCRAARPIGSDADAACVAITVSVVVCTVFDVANHALDLLSRVASVITSHFVLFFHTYFSFPQTFRLH